MKVDKHRQELSRMREAVAESTGERHCSYCNKFKTTVGGKWKQVRHQRRWMCEPCYQLRISK